MDISMTVRRADLLEALKAKRDEVAEQTKQRFGSVEKDLKDLDEYTTSFLKVRKEITKMLEDGRAELAYDGRGEGTYIQAVGKNKLPERPPLTRRIVNLFHSRTAQKQSLEAAAKATRPYDAAIQLLEMSVDENVGVPAAEYQRLLAGDVDQPKDLYSYGKSPKW